MASGSFYYGIDGDHYRLQINWSSVGNVAGNYSDVTLNLYFLNDWGITVASCNGNTTMQSTQSGYTAPAISNGTQTGNFHSTFFHTQTLRVYHNASGTATCYLAAYYPINATLSGTYYASMTVAQTVTLDNLNQPPSAPSIVYPAAGSTIYTTLPRIALQINSDPNNNTQVIDVSFNNFSTYYNTVTYSAQYSQSGSSGYMPAGTKVIFVPVSALPTGSCTVYARTYDGQVDGASTSVNFTIAAPPFTDPTLTSKQTLIKAAHISELRTMINNVRTSVGLASYSWTDPTLTAQSTLVKAVHFSDLRAAITDCRNVLNNWDSSTTKFDVAANWVNTLAAGNIEYTDVINEIRNALSNI